MARIESPDPSYSGDGPGGIHFVNGTAETDDAGVIAYCQGAGYVVDGEQRNPAPAARETQLADPRFVRDRALGTPARDAAVDPRPGDVAPSHAGQANPHGPEVVAPGMGAPPMVADASGEGLVPVTEVEPQTKPPARSASKAEWKSYAVAQGMSEEEAERSTRDQLAERYAPGGGS